ncbi:uncharacterized protein IL334_001399 [Kwoniella shivajii]|uniref:amidase n=1 Tax=Kwoniella shivajii TaxID=564305 RepID=A0ABZ1CW12_9TREE|nr:hypothetical protein IL334_001399 [Kwoniella shivajii]
MTWQEAAAEYRATRDANIPKEYLITDLPSNDVLDVKDYPTLPGVLPALDLEITQTLTVTELIEAIKEGKYSAVQVTEAFCRRAVLAHQLTNCLTEVFFGKAISRAKDLDEYFEKTGKTVGPLHYCICSKFAILSVPISLKDQVEVEGTNFTMSYVGWIGKKASHSAVIAELLSSQGAVFYCRTNMSQGLWFGEGYNNLFGRTTNPFNRNVTCGGSSGGEGALVGLRGSLLGVGSDIGGSVRIPAAYQALYGVRGSYARIPYCKASNSSEGQEMVRSVLGPITASIDGLKTFYKAVLDAKPWEHDPWTPRMPWSESAYALADHGNGDKLCFAIMWDDGVAKPCPPYVRALQQAKDALIAAGHEVIDWTPFKSAESGELLMRFFTSDGGYDLKKQLALSGEPQLGGVLDRSKGELSAHELFDLCYIRSGHIKDALDHWNATVSKTSTGRPVDAIIAPAAAAPPQPHDGHMYIGYTGFCNLNDYVSSILPVAHVDPSVDTKINRDDFLSDTDRQVHEQYDPALQAGAPCSLQIIGKKYEEEAIIRMTEIADAALKSVRS